MVVAYFLGHSVDSIVAIVWQSDMADRWRVFVSFSMIY